MTGMRMIARACVVTIILCITLLSGKAWAEKRIGILMFSGQERYFEAVKGFEKALKEADLGETEMKIGTREAGASKAKAAELVEQLAADRVDLILTVGTHATLAVTQKIKDIPVVFAQVYDPVEAGIAKAWENSGNNTTGVATKLPMSILMNTLEQFAPAKRLGVFYTPGERNSEAQLRDLQETRLVNGIKVVPAPLSNAEEIAQLLPLIIASTDALYVTGSNLVDGWLQQIVEPATRAKLVTITHLEDLVEQGVLLGVVPSSYKSGRLAGEMAAKILLGALPSSIPIETPKQFNVVINLKTAKAGGFTVSPDFMKTVGRTIE